MIGARSFQRLVQRSNFLVASDESAEPTRCRGGQACSCCACARQIEYFERVFETSDRNRTEGFHLDESFRQTQRVGGKSDRARRGQLLHAARQVGGHADDVIVHAEIVADRAYDNLAGIQSDPKLNLEAVLPAGLLGVVTSRILHGECGVTGPHRVILVRQAAHRTTP